MFKRLFRLVLCWIASGAVTLAAQPLTTLFVKYLPPSQELEVAGQIQSEYGAADSTVHLLLSSRVQSLSVFFRTDIDSIPAEGKRLGADTVAVSIPAQAVFANSWQLNFSYSWPLDPLQDSLILLDRGHRWYPILLDQLVNAITMVALPDDYRVLSVGKRFNESALSGVRTVAFQTLIPVFKIPLLIYRDGYFREVTTKCGETKITIEARTVADSVMRTIVAEACSTLVYMEKNFGPYHHPGLTLVETSEFPGMNIGTGIVTIGSDMMAGFAQGYYEGLHLCIAQQWFGAGAFVHFPTQGFWLLTVSLPHQIRLMYETRDFAPEEQAARWEEQLDPYRKFAGTERDVPLLEVDMPNTQEKGALIYSKAPRVFEEVRRCVGDERWREFLRALYRDYQGKQLDWPIFVSALEPFDQDHHCTERMLHLCTSTGESALK